MHANFETGTATLWTPETGPKKGGLVSQIDLQTVFGVKVDHWSVCHLLMNFMFSGLSSQECMPFFVTRPFWSKSESDGRKWLVIEEMHANLRNQTRSDMAIFKHIFLPMVHSRVLACHLREWTHFCTICQAQHQDF